jgi:hypothetical protein
MIPCLRRISLSQVRFSLHTPRYLDRYRIDDSFLGLCAFVINIVAYYEVVVTVEPKRRALAEANAQLQEANSTLAQVRQQVI